MEFACLEFSGWSARRGPITWGQDAIIRELRWLGEEAFTYNYLARASVPSGTSTDDVFAVIRAVTETYEGLRTVFEGLAGSGPSMQVVHGDGVIKVRLVDSDKEDAGISCAISDADRCFALEDEWPVRWTLNRSLDGRPTELFSVLSHSAVDGVGRRLIEEELRERLVAAGGVYVSRGLVWQPLDQARYERAALSGRSRAAVARWIETAARAPEIRLGRALASEDAQFQCYELVSPAAACATQVLAQDFEASTSTVLLSLVAMTIAALAGSEETVMKVVVGNRFDARSRAHIGCLVQDGIVRVHTTGSFRAIVRRAWPAALRMYAMSQYDPAKLEAATDRYASETGRDADPRVVLNDWRFTDEWRALMHGSDRRAISQLLRATTVRHVFTQERIDVIFYIEIAEDPRALRMSLVTDPGCVRPEAIPGILLAMEEFLVAAATHSQRNTSDAGILPLLEGVGL